MKRVSKSPEERRLELMEAAEALFSEKGFGATMIRDIVKSLGVAQGTFYNYFKSKDEILIALLEKDWQDIHQLIIKEMERVPGGPLEEFKVILGFLFSQPDGRVGINKYFIDGKDDPSTIEVFHRHFDSIRVKMFLPTIQSLVLRGMEEGIFKTLQHPEDVTEIIFYGISSFIHIHSSTFNNLQIFMSKINALEELLEISLGVPRGTFSFNK